MVFHRFGNLIRLIKDGFLLQSWLWLQTKEMRFMLLRGHKILEGNGLKELHMIGVSVAHYNFQTHRFSKISLYN